MNRVSRTAIAWRAAGVLALLLGLLLPHSATAQAAPAQCVDGYALVATAAGQSEALMLSGSSALIAGRTRSNSDVRISGSNNRLTGAIAYATSFEDSGDANSYPAPGVAPAAPAPLTYDMADYRPGGAAAQAASAAGRYRQISGDMDVPEGTTLSGLYYVTGDAKLGGANIRGTFTIVAEGKIDVSGSNLQALPYADGLLLLAGRQEPGAAVLKLAGSDGELRGVIAAPGGMAELSGSSTSIVGAVVGRTLKLSGSALRISAGTIYCPGAAGPESPAAEPYVAGEVVIKLNSAADLGAVALANGLNPTPLAQFGARAIYLLAIADGTDPQLKADRLLGDSRVQFAEPNFEAQTPEGRRGRSSWVVGETEVGYSAQWAPGALRLSDAHVLSDGAGVTVAVLDTGADLGHPALAGRLTPGYDFVDDDAVPAEVGVYGVNRGFGHGTHVAGLVALVAPAAKIMPVRALDAEGRGNIWVLAEALLFAAERGPDGAPGSGDEAHVINLSLSTLRQTQLLDQIVGELACVRDDDDGDDDDRCVSSRGVVVIVAAGNDGNSVPHYPAAEGVAGSLAIGASTEDEQLASFSSYGAWVPLLAPGASVVSTTPGGGYATWSGTSMAAPLTAGAAALLRASEANLSAVQVTERLVETARTICGPVPARLDAAAALGAPGAPPVDCSQALHAHRTYLSALWRG